MTDHANELRRYSRKIGHPAGDVPSVMLAAADEIERLAARLEADEKERDALRNEIACVKEVEFPRKAQAVADAWKGKCKRLEAERDALHAKIEQMEKQEPFDADSDVFRGAFEAALKAGNWPATRQGDGYRSPSTQIAWRIAFSTVNRLKLYLAPGAQPSSSVPEGWKLVPIVSTAEMDNAGADHCDGYWNTAQAVWDAMLAVAPEAKP